MAVPSIQQTRAVARALSDPFAPTLCHFCFLDLSPAFESPEQILLILRPEYHELWTAVAAFVSADWTAAREEVVTSRIRKAGASCRYHRHIPFELPNGRTFFGFIYEYSAGYILEAMVKRKPKHEYKGFGRKPSRWPTTMEQLFPYGPERTVRSLVAQLPRRGSVCDLLRTLLSYHRPLVFPALLLPDVRAQLIATIVSRFTNIGSAVDDALAVIGPSALPVVREATAKEPMEACQALGRFLLCVARGWDSLPEEKDRFSAGYEVELFQAIDAFFKSAGTLNDLQLETMGHLATQFWVSLSETQRADVGYPQPPSYALGFERVSDLNNPYRALHLYLRNRPRAAACSGPTCAATVHDDGGRLYQCGKCRNVWYCSRTCQRADWTRGVPPHKELCAALHALSEFTPLDAPTMTLEEFIEACTARAFPVQSVALIITWATQGQIASRYARGGESVGGT